MSVPADVSEAAIRRLIHLEAFVQEGGDLNFWRDILLAAIDATDADRERVITAVAKELLGEP